MAENKESLATEEEMRRYANIAKPKSEVPEVRELIHWTTEEELLAPVSVKAPRSCKAPSAKVAVTEGRNCRLH